MHRDMDKTNNPRAIPGSPFAVQVGSDRVDRCNDNDNTSEAETGNWKIKSPLCIDAYASSQEYGRWVQTSSEVSATRSGWVWAPFYCQFDFQPVWKLPCTTKPLWIMIMGTSTTRGLYFMTLDLILGEKLVQEIGLERRW